MSMKGVKGGGVPNPPYHFSRLLFGIHILHTKKIPSQILHTPYHFQTFKSPISKNSTTKSCIPKKMKDKSCVPFFFICAPKCSVIYSPQLFTDYKEAKGIHLSSFWKCCLAKGNPFIFHSNPAFKSGKISILHTS